MKSKLFVDASYTCEALVSEKSLLVPAFVLGAHGEFNLSRWDLADNVLAI
jgi:hypothetical protein